jgi:hypothetical protein
MEKTHPFTLLASSTALLDDTCPSEEGARGLLDSGAGITSSGRCMSISIMTVSKRAGGGPDADAQSGSVIRSYH